MVKVPSEPVPRRVAIAQQRKEYNRKQAKKQQRMRTAANRCPDCHQPKDCKRYRCSACQQKQQDALKAKREHTNQVGRERRAAKKAAGVCIVCPQPAAPGFSRCLKHVESSRQAKTKFTQRQLANGKCTQCNNAAVEGSQLCEVHIRKREAHVEFYREIVASGVCRLCRKSPADSGKVSCSSCREATNRQNAERRRQRKAAKLCTTCANPSLDHSTLCRPCYLKRVATQNGLTASGWVELGRIWDEQAGLCAYSGEPLTLGLNASLDHIVAVASGGTSVPTNLQWVTRVVNAMKRDLSEEQFLSVIRAVANHRNLGDKRCR
jgi:hypothetical protein